MDKLIKMANNTFPKQIYVLQRQHDDDKWLEAQERIRDLPDDSDGDVVGIYELKTTATFQVRKELSK